MKRAKPGLGHIGASTLGKAETWFQAVKSVGVLTCSSWISGAPGENAGALPSGFCPIPNCACALLNTASTCAGRLHRRIAKAGQTGAQGKHRPKPVKCRWSCRRLHEGGCRRGFVAGARRGELALMGVPSFCFPEGRCARPDWRLFRERSNRLTRGGLIARCDAGRPGAAAATCSAVAVVYGAAGRTASTRPSPRTSKAMSSGTSGGLVDVRAAAAAQVGRRWRIPCST